MTPAQAHRIYPDQAGPFDPGRFAQNVVHRDLLIGTVAIVPLDVTS